MPITTFFFDFDGTLQGFDSHQLSDSTKEAIHILKRKGAHVFLATGRNLIDTPIELKDLGFDGYINNNGGRCSDADLYSFYIEYLPKNDIEQLIAYSKVEDISFSFMTENEFVINQVNDFVVKSFEFFKLEFPQIVDYNTINLDRIMQMNLFVDDILENHIMQTVLPHCESSRWMPYFADVNPKGINKMNGIYKMLSYYNLDLNNTMAFGDGGNDISMIQGCTIGVAMGNANQSLKDVADYVTTSADDDGIWNALKYYHII